MAGLSSLQIWVGSEATISCSLRSPLSRRFRVAQGSALVAAGHKTSARFLHPSSFFLLSQATPSTTMRPSMWDRSQGVRQGRMGVAGSLSGLRVATWSISGLCVATKSRSTVSRMGVNQRPLWLRRRYSSFIAARRGGVRGWTATGSPVALLAGYREYSPCE